MSPNRLLERTLASNPGSRGFSEMWCVGDKTDARDNETTNDVAVAWFAEGPQRLLIVSEDT
jgi:hypothetical protein